MIVKAIIDRIKDQQTAISIVLPIGNATDTNIGAGTDPYILVGELDSDMFTAGTTVVRIRVCYPRGYSAFLDEMVVYTLREIFDEYRLKVLSRDGKTTSYTCTSIGSLSGTGFSDDGYIFRDREIIVPSLE